MLLSLDRDPSSSEVAPFINLPTYVDALHNFDVTASDESTAKKSSAECIPEETSRGNMRVAFAYPIANEKKLLSVKQPQLLFQNRQSNLQDEQDRRAHS